MSTLEQALRRLRDQRKSTARSGPFRHQLEALRRWQADRIVSYHRDLARRHDAEDLLHFLACTFYRDADWSELTATPERTAARIGRIISNDRPLRVTIELQVITNRLDEAMTQALLTVSDAPELSATAYVRAFRATGSADLRARQLELLERLIDLLGRKADNRAAYWGFRMARAPAYALGLRDTYALLADGFGAMRATRDFGRVTGTAIERQRARIERLLA